jgi:hypothetical protein
MLKDDPTTLYIYPDAADIDAIARAVAAGRSLSRAGLYWNPFCLKETAAERSRLLDREAARRSIFATVVPHFFLMLVIDT